MSWRLTKISKRIIQNDHNSVAFVMFDNLLETIVNLHDFYSLNLWIILSGGLGWSSHTVICKFLDLLQLLESIVSVLPSDWFSFSG